MTVSAADVRIVLTTVGSEKNAVEIARHLVEQGLAACVNIIPYVRSIYSWKNAVQDDRELFLVIKVHRDRLSEVENQIKKLHTYETPEFVVLNAEQASESYLKWWLDHASGKTL